MDFKFEQDMLENLYLKYGLCYLIHSYVEKLNSDKPVAAALSLAFAQKKAHLCIEQDGKSILVDLKNGQYYVYVWTPNGFVNFGLNETGFGYNSKLEYREAFLRLSDAYHWLFAFSAGRFTGDQQFLNAFLSALRKSTTLAHLIDTKI